MSIQRDADKLNKQRLADAIAAMTGRFEVASTGPLMVYLDGDDDEAVPGVALDAMTYTEGATGHYLMVGRQVICLLTA